ncbi:MAG TPA: sigma-70 family RNA polymerase sigma factor [Gemmataceae bacterium]|nr:sigma-70 family RNA polymerase sigma factor [Gemmataceae bacterium]
MVEFPSTRASLLLRLRDPQDEGAWAEFVQLYAPLVYGYARKQGLQDAGAADLSQDVFHAVASAIGRLDYDPARGSFRNWLFTVVRRKLLNWQATRRNRAQGSGDAATHQLLEQCPAPEPQEAEWEAEWQRRLYDWACVRVRREVTDATWQAFWRTAVDGQPVKQVAADLGISAGAVYIARSRILARLKELVQSVQGP